MGDAEEPGGDPVPAHEPIDVRRSLTPDNLPVGLVLHHHDRSAAAMRYRYRPRSRQVCWRARGWAPDRASHRLDVGEEEGQQRDGYGGTRQQADRKALESGASVIRHASSIRTASKGRLIVAPDVHLLCIFGGPADARRARACEAARSRASRECLRLARRSARRGGRSQFRIACCPGSGPGARRC